MKKDRLYIFGDSIMKGVMWDARSGRYKLCDSRNFDSIARSGIEVCNKSKMGATVDRGVEIIERSIAQDGSGNCVLLEYGGNDCDFDWSRVSDDPSGSFEPNVAESAFREKYRSLIARAKESGARVFVSTLLPIDAEKYMDWISRGRSRENILAWLGDVSMLSRWQEHYNAVVLELAREADCGIIDIRTPFLLRHDFKELLCEDGIHPTQKGHDLIESVMRAQLAAV